jgi:hypothetical protein
VDTAPRIVVPAASRAAEGVALDLMENITAGRPAQATRVIVSRTAGHLNVLFQCEDSRPWATITERNGPLYQEETVEIFLDPFGDLACYFEIEVNPLNTVLDLMLRRIGRGWRKDFEWQCEGLETSVSIIPGGWTATMSIPFAALSPQPPHPGSIWRANFLRIDRPESAPRELSAWSPTLRNTFHEPRRFGYLEF